MGSVACGIDRLGLLQLDGLVESLSCRTAVAFRVGVGLGLIFGLTVEELVLTFALWGE